MLILNRKPNESVLINGNIRVTLLPGNKLGIEAPIGLPILREELVAGPNAKPVDSRSTEPHKAA